MGCIKIELIYKLISNGNAVLKLFLYDKYF